jgi:hypothetical protein
VWRLTLILALLTLAPSALGAPDVSVCKGALEPSLVGGCEGIDYTGCCDLSGRAMWCDKGDLYCVDCADGFESCGWNTLGYYDCGQAQGSADPSGDAPASCDPCPPECTGGAECSPTCAGLCGTCSGDAVCLSSGACYTDQCGSKECGIDPLGVDCGQCGPGTTCVEGVWQCLEIPAPCQPKATPGCDGCACEPCVCELHPSCCTQSWDLFCASACELACGASCDPCPPSPSCDGIDCGSYCGVDCGNCADGELCLDFSCCAPSCEGKSCGDDGCGGSCGGCTGNDVCVDGECAPCPASCEGKVCGDDGCGGPCGECAEGSYCVGGACSISACDGRCESGDVSCGQDCTCSCNASCFEFGDCCPGLCDVCGASFPNNCCVPDCDGKTCGDDGCEGSCGGCPPGQLCDAAFHLCIDCTPDCFGKACGDDGCGGACGACEPGLQCGATGQCQACEPACDGKVCGDDGCGGLCGSCAADSLCVEGGCAPLLCSGQCGAEVVTSPEGEACSCSPFCLGETNCCAGFCDSCGEDYESLCCAPQCDGRECGDDGCWGSCGACKVSQSCIEGVCVTCQPDCLNKGCGPDGCGGSCGSCSAGFECEGGYCVVCEPDCVGNACGPDGCGGSCGSCNPGTLCEGNDCVDCDPVCAGLECGDDSCGGFCNDISETADCQDNILIWCDAGRTMTIDCGAYNQNCVLHELEGHRCLPIESCEATCIGKNCGDNGCGGFCGTCQTGEVCEDGLCSSVGAIPSDVEGSPDTWASLEQDTSTEAPAPPDDSSGCQAPASGPLNGLLLMALGAFIAWRRRHPEVQSR